MKRIQLLQATLLITISSVALATLRHQHIIGQPRGHVSGTVTDITEARVSGATITIEGEGAKRTITAANDGTYEVELPVGIYRIKVNSAGFCPARRAAFKVQSLTVATFGFTLVVCPTVNNIIVENGRYKGETDGYQSPFKEEDFPVGPAGSPLDLLIRYGRRRKDGNIIEYTGYKSSIQYTGHSSGDKRLGVTVSYNLLTINAEKVRLNPKTLRLEAEGSVVIENGRQQTYAKRAVVEFKAGESVIELAP